MSNRKRPTKHEQTAFDTLTDICKNSKNHGEKIWAAIAILQATGKPVTIGLEYKNLRRYVAIVVRRAENALQEEITNRKPRKYTKRHPKWNKSNDSRPENPETGGAFKIMEPAHSEKELREMFGLN